MLHWCTNNNMCGYLGHSTECFWTNLNKIVARKNSKDRVISLPPTVPSYDPIRYFAPAQDEGSRESKEHWEAFEQSTMKVKYPLNFFVELKLFQSKRCLGFFVNSHNRFRRIKLNWCFDVKNLITCYKTSDLYSVSTTKTQHGDITGDLRWVDYSLYPVKIVLSTN